MTADESTAASASSPALSAEDRARLSTLWELGLLDPAFDDSLDRVVRLLRSVLDVPMAAFSVIGEDRQLFKARDGLDVCETSREISFCSHAIRERQAMVITDATRDPRFRDNPLVTGDMHLRFYAGCPVHAPNGVPVGALCAMDTRSREFSSQQLALLQELTTVMEQMLLLRSQSLIDPLTGLHNRRHFDRVVTVEWRRAFRELLPLSLLAIDIDHFKSYNDAYGHPAGDRCLQGIAALLRESATRAADLVARFGGEEFVMLLPGTSLHGAQNLARDVLVRLQQAAWEHRGTATGRVTLSIGGAVAETMEDLQRGEQALLAAADTALYTAKAAGRNRLHMVRLSQST